MSSGKWRPFCLGLNVLRIVQYWFRQWLGTEQATSHCLNPCLLRYLTWYGDTKPLWVNDKSTVNLLRNRIKWLWHWLHHAIIFSNVDLLSIRCSDIYFNEFLCKIQAFSWEKIHLKMLSAYCWFFSLALTLNVRGPSYLGLTGSISWLLMPWLLTSPGHQQPWYWLCRIGRFLSHLRKDFN